MQGDRGANPALFTVRRDHHNFAEVADRIDKRPQAGGINTVVVSDKNAGDCWLSMGWLPTIDCTQGGGNASRQEQWRAPRPAGENMIKIC